MAIHAGVRPAFLSGADCSASNVARAAIETYTYVHPQTGLFVYCLDNARFMNHSDDPTTAGVHSEGSIEGHDVAVRDIAEGEELTCDYRLFDADFAKKLGLAFDRLRASTAAGREAANTPVTGRVSRRRRSLAMRRWRYGEK